MKMLDFCFKVSSSCAAAAAAAATNSLSSNAVRDERTMTAITFPHSSGTSEICEIYLSFSTVANL